MTSSSKSALRFGPVAPDMPDGTPRAHSSSIDRQQLEHVRPCAEALRLAIATRPAGLPAKDAAATRSGGADRAEGKSAPCRNGASSGSPNTSTIICRTKFACSIWQRSPD